MAENKKPQLKWYHILLLPFVWLLAASGEMMMSAGIALVVVGVAYDTQWPLLVGGFLGVLGCIWSLRYRSR